MSYGLDTLFGVRRGSSSPSSIPSPASVPAPAKPSILPSFSMSSYMPTYQASNPTMPSQGFLAGMIAFFFYLSLIAFFIFLILVFIHFTVTPIFKFDMNEKGLINVSASNDGQIVWKNAIAEADQKGEFQNPLNCNYTISMDILVKNQLSMSSTPRVILYRAPSAVSAPRDKKPSDLFDLYRDTNLLIYLDADKNDLNVVAVTMDNTNTLHPEGIPPIPNIPLETPFRISVMFQPGYMEVYMNGQLQATRVFTGRPKETSGTFFAPSEFVRESVRIGNLQYWPRILVPSEIEGSGPVLPGADFFVVKG